MFTIFDYIYQLEMRQSFAAKDHSGQFKYYWTSNKFRTQNKNYD